MPTVTIPRTDITSEQISAALRDGLDARYDLREAARQVTEREWPIRISE